MQAFLLYIDDWISSKRIEMMDAAEERGYLRLLMRAAKEPDCCLPNDDHQLSIMSLLGPQWFKPTADKARRFGALTSGQKLRQCFVVTEEGKLLNERLYKEFLNQKRVHEARAAAGSKGGRPRKEQETNSFSIDNQLGEQSESKTKASRVGLGFRASDLEFSSSEEESSVYRKSEEIRKNAAAQAIARDLKHLVAHTITLPELEHSWERHHKHGNLQTIDLAYKAILSLGEGFSAPRFREHHPRYCDYWDRRGWEYSTLSFIGWLQAGMPDAPPDSQPRETVRESKTDEALRLMTERAAKALLKGKVQ